MVYIIQLASRIRTDSSWSCLQAFSKPVWHIPLLSVQWKTPDDWQRNCPKHVEFYSKNKFEELVHLIGFIIRIFHDSRSPERQILCKYWKFWRNSYTNILDASSIILVLKELLNFFCMSYVISEYTSLFLISILTLRPPTVFLFIWTDRTLWLLCNFFIQFCICIGPFRRHWRI